MRIRRDTPVLALVVVQIVLACALLAVATFAVQATERAQTEADRARAAAATADQATVCNTLLLDSIAQGVIDPRALRCDVTTALMVIERGKARDLAVVEARDRTNRLVARLARQVNEVERRLQTLTGRSLEQAARPPVVRVVPVPRREVLGPPAPRTAPTPRTAPAPAQPVEPTKPGKGKGRK